MMVWRGGHRPLDSAADGRAVSSAGEMWLRHRPSRPDRWVALLVLLASIAAAAGQSTPCPANSDGEGDGMECICEEGYEGRITYNDAETPPTDEGACERVKTDYFLGMGTGFLMGVILLAISALAFNIAGKTSFECSMCVARGTPFRSLRAASDSRDAKP